MRWPNWLRRYVEHPDPATAASNLVALVIASNGPFYPLYVLALIGWENTGVWLTMLASPFFMLMPVISRRHPATGRVALPVIGIVNTVGCTFLFGSTSRVELFLLPCITLIALQFRGCERRRLLSLLGLAVGTQIWLTEFPPAGLMILRVDQAEALARLNAISVATLSAFLVLSLANVLRNPDRMVTP
jgi:hypothetical protein